MSTRQSQGMYVGETAKNLVRLVDVAGAFDSVLLFNEAANLVRSTSNMGFDGVPASRTTTPGLLD